MVMAFLYIIIRWLCEVLSLAIVARVIVSWFSPSPTNWLFIILYRVTEPFLAPLRRIIPRVGMFDFTPVVAIIILQIIVRLLRLLI